MFPGELSPRIHNQVLKDTAELVCGQIASAAVILKLDGRDGEVISVDRLKKVYPGKQITRAVYVPRQYRILQVYAYIFYYDAIGRDLMSFRVGLVENGTLVVFTATRPSDFHYDE
jgi:hypothetical protein